MMATAPTVHESPTPDTNFSEPQQISSDLQDGDHNEPELNGSLSNEDDSHTKGIRSTDDITNSANVSVSGGSDTEASRGDGSKAGDKGHGRTASSAKKPATFKAVSVNRTFLASKAAANSASSKASDKPSAGPGTPPSSSATLSVSRPRLVAKTGSGNRDSLPRSASAANGAKPANAPDASAVWNKNRPPEPKKFTDEELKKYGIHMASRLEEDEVGGQNKWADIDDDDDDWAPDAITWGDGTKTTLPNPEDEPPPPPEPIFAPQRIVIQEKPRSPAPLGTVGSPLPKGTGLASGKGLILKSGPQEKPTLVAKPPAPPTPAKSPWATLPPVDRTAAIVSPEMPLSRYPMRDQVPMRGGPPMPIGHGEFSRSSWRDGQSNHPKELFNSQSGQYEPVMDRRSSLRSDQAKQLALLQRHAPGDGPAEPSSAFQTSRTSHDPPFGRRRGSSNVSGGSGSFFSRTSKGHDGSMPPPELGAGRRPSLAGSMDVPVSPNLSVAGHGFQRQHHPQGWVPGASPGSSHALPHYPDTSPVTDTAIVAPVAPQQQAPDDVEFQKKLMHERVELARKRRQEQEAKEEAEKQERIQKKLQAMGPAPEKKSEKSNAPAAPPRPTQIQQREHPAHPNQAEAATKAEADGASYQTEQPARTPSQQHRVNGDFSKAGQPRRLSHTAENKPHDGWAKPSQRPERLPPWSGAVPPPPMHNVWGSPNNDRGLGNGTFNPDLGRPNTSAPPQPGKGPSPIAPPGSTQGPPGRPQPQAPTGSRAARYGVPTVDFSNWASAVAESDKKMKATLIAERDERERQMAQSGLSMAETQPAIKDTWRPVHVPGDGTRHDTGSAQDSQSQQPASWKPARGDHGQAYGPREGEAAAKKPGVIGSGPSIMPQSGQGSSKFFPKRGQRQDVQSGRPSSPTPPPPTMEGHPAYEGDVMRPHVSLPKPQPVVKLPPSMGGPQQVQVKAPAWGQQPQNMRDARAVSQPHATNARGNELNKNWQTRIDSLFNKGSQPKHMNVESSTRTVLDHPTNRVPATVSLPGTPVPFVVSPNPGSPVTKPMAEECFEEQEMGSLPQIRVPHKVPDAAWELVPINAKPLPRKFLIQASVMEPIWSLAEATRSNTLKIHFPGMSGTRTVGAPLSVSRGGKGGHAKPSSRQRGSGHGSSRGGKKESPAPSEAPESSTTSTRGGRGGYRSRGSDNWSRSTPKPSSTPA